MKSISPKARFRQLVIKLAYRRNNKAIDEQLALCGYFLIAETDFKKTTAEILEIYRNRDVVEKSFDSLKNELDMKRLHTWTSETAQGIIPLPPDTFAWFLKRLRGSRG